MYDARKRFEPLSTWFSSDFQFRLITFHFRDIFSRSHLTLGARRSMIVKHSETGEMETSKLLINLNWEFMVEREKN